ncbi:MAG: DMT family transporter [Firmicutes bacterium]|nr:DMT family transporter [Bacillota bacterium]
MKNKNFSGILLAVSAAALYALNAPCSKLLLAEITPTMLAALLYLGAGTGMFLTGLLQRILCHGRTEEKRLTTKDLPYTAAMVLLDIAAPVLLMAGLSSTTAANASLLNNFEIAATSVIALWLFHEKISPRLTRVVVKQLNWG